MTSKELSQLYWLNKEIEREKLKLLELETAASGCTAQITGLPHVGKISDKTGEMAILIKEQRELVELKVKQSVIEYNRLNRYIMSIDDAYMRNLLTLRHVNGLAWWEVATQLGFDGDGSTQRKQHKAFLEKLSRIS